MGTTTLVKNQQSHVLAASEKKMSLLPCTGDIPDDALVYCSTLSATFQDNCVTACNENGISPTTTWIIIALAILVLVSAFWACSERFQYIKHMINEHGVSSDSALLTAGSMKRGHTGGAMSSGCRNYGRSDIMEF